MPPTPVTSRAFTLIEAALSVAIVGVLLTASVGTFGTLTRGRASQAESRLGMMLAQQLMSEIVGEKFQQAGSPAPFGPQAGQTRATFSAVDGYDGYTATPPENAAGTALADYAGWTQAAAVAFVDPAAPNTVVASSTLKRVTVTVTAPSKKAYVLVGWRSKFGAFEVLPNTVSSYVVGVAVTLQGQAPGRAVYTTAHPLNGTGQ